MLEEFSRHETIVDQGSLTIIIFEFGVIKLREVIGEVGMKKLFELRNNDGEITFMIPENRLDEVLAALEEIDVFGCNYSYF